MKQFFHSNNESETMDFAKKLGRKLEVGDLLLLEGDLGAGKTTFTKGLAEGLDIKKIVKSPTFTIIREYKTGRLPLYHMDVYRLEDASTDELGLFEYFQGDGVSVVEWAHYIADELPPDYLKITITRESDEGRLLTLEPVGERYVTLLAEVLES
ncbi:hypothetical protein MFLO_12421 [Listeria floridensis FSL S10-1187]|uniref:tRNA threonylcarbamoyladenosine biosynthesis protein TsaE n=1 Tax=Listeria floridensis FSL S10-1187 TaxID=1265817 RepID=A0ABN0RCY5_9LIST|nr:tRNA (adenosine(37)-N6)-threonylcarbamoyltransferase complex ATPase subunit type 1 TsaE [Listeria floridensis]EUJ28201.1 hypothetical protein MFLO_12421 [Listeria floridensis FSL S10-1187]